jgi:hypothetical protein
MSVFARQSKFRYARNKPWQKSVKILNIIPNYRFVLKVKIEVKVKFTLEETTNAQGGLEV